MYLANDYVIQGLAAESRFGIGQQIQNIVAIHDKAVSYHDYCG